MLLVKDNGLNLGAQTATIKLYSVNHGVKIQALYALLGGYNEIARNVDVDKFHKLQAELNDIVTQMTDLMAD